MTGADLSPAAPEPPEDLAGEYVLGVLDAAAWREASLRLRTDDAFAAEVRLWEDRLAPLLLESRDAAPSRDLWPDIRRALPADRSGSVAYWRGLAAASALIAAACLAVVVLDRGRPQTLVSPPPAAVAAAPAPEEPMQVALLKPVSGPTAFVATLDRKRRIMTVSPGAAPSPKGKSLELWMIPPGGAPQALGVIPADRSAKMPMPDAFEGRGDTPIVLAVSVEPTGGSPTGHPTGPVVARGRFSAV